jgi:hypothetical protein
MHSFNALRLILLVAWLLASPAPAQDTEALITNAPLTILEKFEARSGAVLIKATGPVGAFSLQAATVSVTCRETTDVGAGRRERGVVVTLQRGEREQDTTVIDYNELETFLAGLTYISRVDSSVAPLPSFEVSIKTRGQLRVFIYTSKTRPGSLQIALHDDWTAKPRLLLSPSQLAEFKLLIEAAKAKLDALHPDP